MATRFQLHCQTWGTREGCGSALCPSAMHKVFYRGDIPCDILFIGEAPGKSEDKLGQPFAKGAPAGGLLQSIINQSVPKKYKVGFTNVVACIPRVPGEEKLEPEFEQITSCKPRLEEIIDIASPSLIVAVGTKARDALEQGYLHSTRIPEGTMLAHIVHPAWILRQSPAFQGVEVQRVCCAIRDTIHDLENPAGSPATVERPPLAKLSLKRKWGRTTTAPKTTTTTTTPSVGGLRGRPKTPPSNTEGLNSGMIASWDDENDIPPF